MRGWRGVIEHGDGGEHKFPVTQHARVGNPPWVGAGGSAEEHDIWNMCNAMDDAQVKLCPLAALADYMLVRIEVRMR